MNGIARPNENSIKYITPEFNVSELDERVNNFCKQVCGHTPQVLSLTKDTLYKQISMPIDQAYNFASQAMVDNLQMPETKKGIQSFLKKD